jgi:L-ribulose-5-phosphate 4-epimerase
MSDDMIQGNYEHETGFQIMNEFEYRGYSYKDVEMVLLGNHAPFTWGKTGEKAVYNAAVLEEIARMAYLTCTINPSVSRLKESLIQKHFDRKHGTNAYYGQD